MSALSLAEQTALWLYGLGMWLARPLLRWKLRKRARAEPGYAHDVDARFGRYRLKLPGQPPGSDDAAAAWIWVHAVSLGEARAAAILVERLRRLMPGMRLLLTHSTATGWREGAALLQPGDAQTWLPWDDRSSVKRFLTRYQPAVGVLMETEVWPILVRSCAENGVPLTLANARMNERSFDKALRLRWLSRPAYAGLRAVWAQTADDARRLAALGASVDAVTGNLKFDARPDPRQRELAANWRNVCGRPVVMLASSREGEEAQFIHEVCSSSLSCKDSDATQSVDREAHSLPVWLIVPRHPQRFDAVAALLAQAGLGVRRRAEWGAWLDEAVMQTAADQAVDKTDQSLADPMHEHGHDEVPTQVRHADAAPAGDIWLGDSLGEMALYYSLADVALLGGSFEPLGGQNLIEAAACGCPVVLGPHTFNFAEAAEAAVETGAAFRVDNMADGISTALHLLAHPQAREQAVAAAHAFASSRQGAAGTMARALKRLVAKAEPLAQMAQ